MSLLLDWNNFFVIEGEKWQTQAARWGIIDIVRDSAGFIVNQKGTKMFAYDNYTDTLVNYTGIIYSDTLYYVTYQMEQMDNPVSVPAGTFDVVNYKGTVYTLLPNIKVPNPRYNNNYYADNVGRILESWHYLGSPNYQERRLIRYHIQD